MTDKPKTLQRKVKPAPQETEIGALDSSPALSTTPAVSADEWQVLSTRITKDARAALDYAAYTTGKKKQVIISEALLHYRENL